MSIKLIAIDIDGTLLDPNNQLTQANIDAIQAAEKAGIKVVLCTGRPLSGVQPYLDQLKISGSDQYAITFNGAMVQNLDGKVIVNHTLSFDDFLETEMLGRKLNVHYQIETTDKIYAVNKSISPYTTAESFLVRLPVEYMTPEDFSDQIVMSKAMYVDFPEVISRVKPQLPASLSDHLSVVQSATYFIEIMNKKATKGNALSDLASALNFSASEVMAIGDNGNDLSMIEYAGTGVAMGNAIPEIKEVAQQVTSSNADNGVAQAIKNYAL